jgi:hypothetical protein
MAVRDIEFPTSSNIQAIAYDDDTQDLTITFKPGDRTYVYRGVTGNEADGFTTASSAGEYLNRVIKRSYIGERIA